MSSHNTLQDTANDSKPANTSRIGGDSYDFSDRATSPISTNLKRGNRGGKLPPKESLKRGNRSSSNLWKYLVQEVSYTQERSTADQIDSELDQVISFLTVPFTLEKVLLFGFLTCVDSFLYTFTILPLRFCFGIVKIISTFCRSKPIYLQRGQKIDLLKSTILLGTIYLLTSLDASILYHNIRGQSAVKLYVMFNVLEIGDKLLSSLGQDVLDVLFSQTTLSRPIRVYLFIVVAIIYNALHSAALFCQMITLNVAINSYSNALLTLLLSNQFSEIKSTVFKKFERENLFQLTCADISERFQLWVMLLIIGLRNIVEVSSLSTGILPQSWNGWNKFIGALFGPAMVVLGSEVCVDWLKHSYIAKFNKLRPKVYDRFIDVFCKDHLHFAFSGQQYMTKRIGVPLLPLACVLVKSTSQICAMLIASSPLIPTKTLAHLSETFASVPTALANSETPGKKFISLINFSQLDDLLEYGIYAVIIFSIFCLALLIKLVLGSLLLEYSAARIELNQRSFTTNGCKNGNASLEEDKLDEERVPGERKGGAWGLIDMSGGVREELRGLDIGNRDQPDFVSTSPTSASSYMSRPTSPGDFGPKRKDIDLQTVERFQMVAKRIW
ncbi:eukaryotic membrane protein family-domain-containing protein [Dipodascopsis uninucleata]